MLRAFSFVHPLCCGSADTHWKSGAALMISWLLMCGSTSVLANSVTMQYRCIIDDNGAHSNVGSITV